ncbi:MAG: amidohydrolase family protein, partial [Myxococcota bacterium]
GEARATALLRRLADARRAGVEVTADLYPYNASYTTISIVFPDFALPPHRYSRVKKKRRAELADFLRKRVTKRGGPDATLFGTKPFRGQTLAQVAEARGKPFEDVLIDDIGPGGASAAYFVMDDALQSRLFVDPFVMISTDGGPFSSHPRGYGAFARVWQEHVTRRQLVPLREAVRKMTMLPAETVGLDRLKVGRLAEGWAADILVFDPREIEARSNYERPRRYAKGMHAVVVNGRVVTDEGEISKRRAGRLLLRPSSPR